MAGFACTDPAATSLRLMHRRQLSSVDWTWFWYCAEGNRHEDLRQFLGGRACNAVTIGLIKPGGRQGPRSPSRNSSRLLFSPAAKRRISLGQARRSELPGPDLRLAGQGRRRGWFQPDLVAPQRRLIARKHRPRLLGGGACCVACAAFYGSEKRIFFSQKSGAQPRIRSAPRSRFEAPSGEFTGLWVRLCGLDHGLERHLCYRLIALGST
ncbi:hypothetical protein ABIF14_008794 [Bradyrhizobium elkanii]